MSLIEKRIKEINDGEFFWRKGSNYMWIRMNSSEFIELAPYHTDEIELDLDEVILFYPDYDPSSATRAQVTAWTGNPNPHM